MALKWRKKVILAKIETVYGTDPVPTGAANAILATNISLSPMEGEDVSRNLERPYFGAQENLPVGLHCTLSFDVEMVGSGALGTAPGWGVLHRACAVSEVITAATSVVYTPNSTAADSVTIYVNIDGVLHKMLGVRGTFVAKLNAAGIPVWSYTFTGLFVQPAAGAMPVPVYTGFKDPQVATKATTPVATIGGTAMILRNFEFNRGAQVERRFLINYEAIEIVDAVESLSCQVEAVALATYNPFTAATGPAVAIALDHGTTPATRVKLAFPKSKQRRLSGYANEQNIVEWPLQFDPLPNVQDDQWTITLS